jgi:hypothetical protein
MAGNMPDPLAVNLITEQNKAWVWAACLRLPALCV